jgi:predicted molibdopterin-dependent oxidoreductase YjgC
VGALTSGTYRYKTRPWEMTYTGTTCNHCGDGCKTTLSVRNNVVIRANNRDHSGFNGEFLCGKGRFGWDFVNSEQRLTAPRVRRNGSAESSTWEDALTLTVNRLKDVIAQRGPESVAVIASNRTTNEENYLLGRFARTVLGTNNLDHHRTADYSSLVAALTEAQATDRYATMEDLFRVSSVVLIGNDPTHQHPLVAYQIRQAVRQHGARLYVINASEIKLALRQASVFVKVKPGAEAALVCAFADRQAAAADLLAGPADAPQKLLERLEKEPDTVIVFGDEIRGSAVLELVRWGLNLPARASFMALGDYANSRGAADLGLLPGTLPGYRSVADSSARAHYEAVWGAPIPTRPGRNLREILAAIDQGAVKALLVFGSNPAKTFAGDASVLGKLEFLMVADLFPTETAALADVVLPAASFAEKSGTVTNTCGQVQVVKRTLRKAGTRSDLEIVLALAREFGLAWQYRSSEDVLREIVAHVPGYSVALPSLLIGCAVPTRPEGAPPALEREDLIFSSRDSLFTSGTVSRFSWALNSVGEAQQPHGHIF